MSIGETLGSDVNCMATVIVIAGLFRDKERADPTTGPGPSTLLAANVGVADWEPR